MSTGPQSPSEPTWFKSSYSGGNATECVECAYVSQGALVRDSKCPNELVIAVGGGAWSCFVGAVAHGPLAVHMP
ncbi:DUF397 domain-containing protein [Streptomyces nodosus]|uniref:DUF397 domain-containing protein n=1 Tax=Streptomyces nodosus TaxID=40318 RepID=UPI003811248E